MSTVVKDLGAVSAYAYAVEKGYTGTEAEFAELMASYADVGQTAVDAKGAAVAAKTAAQTAATTATNKASEATTAATTATTKAGEASTSASTATSAKDTAVSASQTATTKATEATTAAATATSAKTDAVAANTAAQSAKTAAQTAQTGAETAAASVQSSAAQIQTNADDISELKEELNNIASFEDTANLFDKTSIVPNKTLGAGSGKTYNSISDSDILSVSPIIPIEGGNSYTGSGLLMGNSARVFYYNENGAYLGGNDGTLNVDGSYTYTFVNVVKYVRFRYTTSLLDIDSYMFVKGTSLPSEYVPYGKYLSSGELVNVKNELSSEINNINDKIDLVDNQLSIRSVLYKVPNTINDDGFINGAYVNGNTGELVSQPTQTTFWCSDYTEIVGGAYYYYSRDIYMSGHMAFYDADRNYISGYETTIPNPFPTPPNAKYVRFIVTSSTITKAKNAWLNIIDEAPEETAVKYAFDKNTILAVDVENPCDYNGDEITVFNKIMCIGDSITAGTFNHNEGGTMQHVVDDKYSYPTYIKKLCGVETLNNGIGGYTSVQWWNARQNADFSGYDCAIINLGINDALQSVSSADTTIALINIINALRTANNGIKIFIATVVPAYSDGTSQFDAVNETIRTVASNNNCYLIDLSIYSHARKATVSEAGHLTAWGYYRLAKDYISAISYIMSQNRSEFKFVQFIGTNYSYT